MYVYLDDIMAQRELTRYRIAKDANIPYYTLDKIYKHKTDSISFAVLERLCKSLNITPNDILRFGDPPDPNIRSSEDIITPRSESDNQ